MDHLGDEQLRLRCQLGLWRPGRIFRRGQTGSAAKHVDVQEGVGTEPVGTVDRHARHLAGCVQARDDLRVVTPYFGPNGGGHAAHGVVGRGVHRHRFEIGLDPQVGAGEVSDVRKLRVDLFWR